MKHDGGDGWHYGGYHFAAHKCIKSTCSTPETYAMLYINYVSVNWGEKAYLEA